ncbi:MAG: hypothetical protein Q9218_007211, partial [Villophora microphyllina]
NSLRYTTDTDCSEIRAQDLASAIHAELHFLSSILTSPLYKHAKSPTLWSHRLWLLRTFPFLSHLAFHDPDPTAAPNQLSTDRFVVEELEVVMKAAERHPRNYYAWNYAREIVRLSSPSPSPSPSGEEGVKGEEKGEREGVLGMDKEIWAECLHKIHKWCLLHPRDISGWSFLVFFIAWIALSKVSGEKEVLEKKEIIRAIFTRTEDFVQKYDWKGESVEWFLASSTHFNIEPNG